MLWVFLRFFPHFLKFFTSFVHIDSGEVISIIELTVCMQSKSHIPRVYPSSQIFHKAPCLVLCILIPSLLFSFKMCFHLLWLPAFSLALFCCLFLQYLKYDTNRLYSISHQYNFRFPVPQLYLFLAINFLHLIYWQSCHFFLKHACCIGLNLDRIPVHF